MKSERPIKVRINVQFPSSVAQLTPEYITESQTNGRRCPGNTGYRVAPPHEEEKKRRGKALVEISFYAESRSFGFSGFP